MKWGRHLRVGRSRDGVSISSGHPQPPPSWSTPARAIPLLHAFTAYFIASLSLSLSLGQNPFLSLSLSSVSLVEPATAVREGDCADLALASAAAAAAAAPPPSGIAFLRRGSPSWRRTGSSAASRF